MDERHSLRFLSVFITLELLRLSNGTELSKLCHFEPVVIVSCMYENGFLKNKKLCM